VSRGGSRRRLHVRRKRKGKRLAREAVEEAGGEVVLETGCCLVEAVVSASVVMALLSVPAYLAFS
jgi:hypothetical protein